MIYLDNAATTRLSDTALRAMLPYLQEQYGNPSSLYAFGQQAQEALTAARGTVARCLNAADPREITFTSGGSEADNQALRSAAYMGARKGKKHLISTAIEHHAVLHTLAALEKEGFSVTLVPVPENGIVRPADIAAAIRPDTCLVSVMFANNEIGTIQPVGEIGALCREKGILFHTDAVQAAGHLPIDVQAQNIDLLSLSAHKFHGPKGAGVLYARKGVVLTPLIQGGAQERGKRAGTENVPACGTDSSRAFPASRIRSSTGTGNSACLATCTSALRASRANPCCCYWTMQASVPPPARPAPPVPWTPAMCCWPSAAPMRLPTALCA